MIDLWKGVDLEEIDALIDEYRNEYGNDTESENDSDNGYEVQG